eukprot:TRINITY_DN9074_c0_g1_i2.p1 TRINITY_DN9074_c0_g1~~TRINITY_DN9074_c0_g1_i2.p1  ORF type:complete len:276 (-),score=40.45 TRINITY_DN9074_c0_g1_i2:34-861(-)
MEFESSTHQLWIFTKDAIKERRESAFAKGIARLTEYSQRKGITIQQISFDEQRFYMRSHLRIMSKFVSEFKLPWKVLSTAVTYLKRFYLDNTVWQHRLEFITPASIALACKTEECAMHPLTIANRFRVDADELLKAEKDLLSGMNFHLYVYSPYRSLHGFRIDMESMNINFPEEFWAECHEALHQIVLTDSMITYSPQVCALSAIYKTSATHRDLLNKYISERLATESKAGEIIVSIIKDAYSNFDSESSVIEGDYDLRDILTRLQTCVECELAM